MEEDILAHAQHAVNLCDAQPVEDVRHEGLEAHVLDAGDHFGPFEVVRRAVFSAFPCVVHHCSLHVSSCHHHMHGMLLEGWVKKVMCDTYDTRSG